MESTLNYLLLVLACATVLLGPCLLVFLRVASFLDDQRARNGGPIKDSPEDNFDTWARAPENQSDP